MIGSSSPAARALRHATARAVSITGAALASLLAAVTSCGNGAHRASSGMDAGADASLAEDAGTCGLLGCVPDLSDASLGVRASSFLGGCAGGPETHCHGTGAGGGLHLPDVPPNLVDVRSTELPAFFRVLPGDPAQSYLYMKLIGDPRIAGVQMPPGSAPVAASEIELVRGWIEAGAPAQ